MKVLPYVYKCTNRKNKNFYYGVRYANKLPAELDLGIKYKTSSKIVKNNFDDFDYEIIAVFFNKKDAIEFENDTILETWKDPLSLNKSLSGKFHSSVDEINRQRMKKDNPVWKYDKENPHPSWFTKEMLTGKKPLWYTEDRAKEYSLRMTGEGNPMFGKTEAADHLNIINCKCEYCGILTNKGNYGRWHGQKCKLKPIEN